MVVERLLAVSRPAVQAVGRFGEKRTMSTIVARRGFFGQNLFQAQARPHTSLPVLPCVERVAEIARQESLPEIDKTLFFVVQHPYATTFSWLKALIDLGAAPPNIFMVDKFYSTPEGAASHARQLGVNFHQWQLSQHPGHFSSELAAAVSYQWDKVGNYLKTRPEINKIVVVGDGGEGLLHIPPRLKARKAVAAVEQTTRGLRKVANSLHPVVSVASSPAKRLLESAIIAQDICFHVERVLSRQFLHGKDSDQVVGIVGNGAIGIELVKRLHKMGADVFVYDKNSRAFDGVVDPVCVCGSAESLIESADIIIGCTGEDVLRDCDLKQLFKRCRRDKVFLSASSEDIEWLTIIQYMRRGSHFLFDPFSNLIYSNGDNITLTVAHSGLPINFNGQEESLAANQIDLTRALMFSAVLQAIKLARPLRADGKTPNQEGQIYALDQTMQHIIADVWLSVQEHASYYPDDVREIFSSPDRIAACFQAGELTRPVFDSLPAIQSAKRFGGP